MLLKYQDSARKFMIDSKHKIGVYGKVHEICIALFSARDHQRFASIYRARRRYEGNNSALSMKGSEIAI